MSNLSSISKSQRNKNGRSKTGKPFIKIYKNMLRSPIYHSLKGNSVKLLFDVASEYNGSNNGDLCVTLSVMKAKGWNSNDKMTRALKELLAKGFLIKTRQGGLNMGCSLYALGWEPIDNCKGKIHVKPTTTAPTKF